MDVNHWYITLISSICMHLTSLPYIGPTYVRIFLSERKWKWSRVRLFATPWTVAHQAPLSMGFSRQEYWSGLPFPSPGDLPNPGIEPRSPAMQADALTSEPPGKLIWVVISIKIRPSLWSRTYPSTRSECSSESCLSGWQHFLRRQCTIHMKTHHRPQLQMTFPVHHTGANNSINNHKGC